MNNNLRIALLLCPCWTNLSPPLGISYIASFLKQKRYFVKCFDFNIDLYDLLKIQKIDYWMFSEHYKWRDTFFTDEVLPLIKKHLDKKIKEVLSFSPHMVGFTLFYTNELASLYVAEQIKSRNKNIKIVFGGPRCYDELKNPYLLKNSFVDAIVIGEGEETLNELADIFSIFNEFRDTRGALVKKGGLVNKFEFRGEIESLDKLPFPYFGDFELKKYKQFALPLLTSRGCIAKCVFCGERRYWKKFRFRTASNVFQEIKHDIDCYKVKDLFFNDSLINGNLSELSELVNLIIKDGLKINWGGYVRVNKAMTPELFKRLKKAGCNYLSYGIESGSQKILKSMKKDISLKDAGLNLKDTTSVGIEAHVNWIVGFPNESWVDFLKSLFFIYKNRNNISCFNPGQVPCGIPADSYLAQHPKEFNIVQKAFLKEWRTKFFVNTIIQRRLRLKILRKFISLLGLKHS
jgi:radical SAM superfamily enzyme YgiQ (UPF0313 family)